MADTDTKCEMPPPGARMPPFRKFLFDAQQYLDGDRPINSGIAWLRDEIDAVQAGKEFPLQREVSIETALAWAQIHLDNGDPASLTELAKDANDWSDEELRQPVYTVGREYGVNPGALASEGNDWMLGKTIETIDFVQAAWTYLQTSTDADVNESLTKIIKWAKDGRLVLEEPLNLSAFLALMRCGIAVSKEEKQAFLRE